MDVDGDHGVELEAAAAGAGAATTGAAGGDDADEVGRGEPFILLRWRNCPLRV